MTTRRARFLRDALRSFDNSDADGLLNLGMELQVDAMAEEIEGLSPDDNLILNQMGAEIREARGAMIVSERMTLGETLMPDMVAILVKHFERLSDGVKAEARPLFNHLLFSLSTPADKVAQHSDTDALDSRYAKELVDLLPSVVSKAERLQRLDIARQPNPSVKRFFDEAHRCYFFGLEVACAVLCRAILEAALKDVMDANEPFIDLVEAARERGLLDQERLIWVRRINRAGNLAIHHEAAFTNRYSDAQIEETLLNTRKVVEDLYSQRRGAGAD